MTRRPHFRPAPPRPDLTFAQILDWADAFMARVGRWPTRKDGTRCLPGTTWSAVDACLKGGHRGLNPGSSLAKLLLTHRGRRHKKYLPPLTADLVLAWADVHHARTGDWPTQYSGPVADAPGETWSGVDCALLEGCRTLPGGSSLAQLLAVRRGVRNHLALPPLTPAVTLGWADAHHARTGAWPRQDSGPIPEAPGESWAAVSQALLVGVRGLPGGSSLARLLAAERGVRNPADVPRLWRWEILVWADNHFDRTGRWPTAESGPIPEAPGERWSAVDSALWAGTRGLPGGDSLTRLLARRRGRRNAAGLPPLRVDVILGWVDAHHARMGDWPGKESGPVADAPGESWSAVDHALRDGRRGLPGGSSLARLLDAERGVRNTAAVPRLSAEQILAWADAHHVRTGRWPTAGSGRVAGVPGEAWSAVDAALETGARGQPGGTSLARLLAAERGVRNHMALPPFTVELILAWADAHHARTGDWPSGKGGAIADAPGETWRAVEGALIGGLRGLPGGDTLARLLARRRGKRNRKALPPLSVSKIRKWLRGAPPADGHMAVAAGRADLGRPGGEVGCSRRGPLPRPAGAARRVVAPPTRPRVQTRGDGLIATPPPAASWSRTGRSPRSTTPRSEVFMSSTFLLQGDGGLVEMTEQPYGTEVMLQELLAEYPDRLAGDQIDAAVRGTVAWPQVERLLRGLGFDPPADPGDPGPGWA
jgi:hypothetical protein